MSAERLGSSSAPVTNTDSTPSPDVIYEGLRVKYQRAPFSKRFLAFLTDIAIVSTVMYGAFIIGAIVVSLFAGVSLAMELNKDSDFFLGLGMTLVLALFVLATLAIYHGYFIRAEYRHGTTLGKKIFGLRVISGDGGKLTVGQCVLRDLLRYIDCMMILPGYLAIRLSKDGRRLGDMVANTLVIYSPKQEQQAEFMYLNPDHYQSLCLKFPPRPIDPRTAEDYLSYAYQVFVLSQLPNESNAYFADVPEQYFRGSDTTGHSHEELQLFFAELCNQTIAKKG